MSLTIVDICNRFSKFETLRPYQQIVFLQENLPALQEHQKILESAYKNHLLDIAKEVCGTGQEGFNKLTDFRL